MSEARLLFIVASVAAAIAEGRSTGELGVLSAVFTLLGDSLAAIGAQRSLCESGEAPDDNS